jgi:hypothetical protein
MTTTIYNDSNYLSPYENNNLNSVDVSRFFLKTGGILNGSVSVPNLSIYNDGNILFETDSGNKTFDKDNVIDIEKNKLKLQHIISDTASTTINNNLVVDKIIFSDLSEQITGFNQLKINEINTNSTKLTQVSYDTDLLTTSFDNSVLINKLTCSNINTDTGNIQTQINNKNNKITSLSRLNSNLVGNGTISNAVFDFLSGVMSSIQNQFSGKQSQITVSSRLNSNLVGNGTISNAVLDFLIDCTSNIQTQINNKNNKITSSARLNTNLLGNGIVSNSVFDFLSGVTSDIQQQFNNITGISTNNLLYMNNSSFTNRFQ